MAQQTARWELFRDKNNKFRFRLRARNGEIVLQSEAYERKASAINAINVVEDAVIARQQSLMDHFRAGELQARYTLSEEQ